MSIKSIIRESTNMEANISLENYWNNEENFTSIIINELESIPAISGSILGIVAKSVVKILTLGWGRFEFENQYS